jgi:hypothetical protein
MNAFNSTLFDELRVVSHGPQEHVSAQQPTAARGHPRRAQ